MEINALKLTPDKCESRQTNHNPSIVKPSPNSMANRTENVENHKVKLDKLFDAILGFM